MYNFRWAREDVLAASSRVFDIEDFKWLWKQSIRALGCLVKSPTYPETASQIGFEYKHIPVEGHEPSILIK